MSNVLEKSDFLSFFGIDKAWQNVQNSGQADYATISTGLDEGAIRVLFLRGAKGPEDDTTSISFKYLYNVDGRHSSVVNFLSMQIREDGPNIHIEQARVNGKKIDVDDPQKFKALSKTVRSLSESIINSNEWINPIELMQTQGLVNGKGVGKKAWPGLYASGDFKNVQVKKGADKTPIFPALFTHAILGVSPDKFAPDRQQSHTLSLHGAEQDSDSAILKYSYKRGKRVEDLQVQGTVAIHGEDGVQEQTFYKIKTGPVSSGKKGVQLKELEYMGRQIDLHDQRAVATILKIIRNTNRTIRAGDAALTEDLKRPPHERHYALPTELMLHTDAYPHLNTPSKIPSKGRMTFQALGGNNTKALVSKADQNIGANQYILGFEYKDNDGQAQSEALMIDAGVLFHDVFDVAFFNAGKYLRHKHNKGHIPEQPVNAILFTHRHKDHLGQLAYLIKCGYELPPLVMNEISKKQIERDMRELDIETGVREEILSKCYTINLLKDVNPQDPEARKSRTIDDTTIEQWTEVVPGDNLGQYHYYPRLKIGAFEVRVGPMPHSDPGLMYDIITPAGTHRHTGDYKFDDTIKLGMPSLETWLKAHTPDSLSADSTGATREGKNPTEAEVGASITQHLNEHPDSRHIFPMLGSNLSRLTTLIDAMGQTDRKVLIVDGKAVEDLVRDADKVYGLKEWAKRAYGIDIHLRTAKKTIEPYITDPSKDGEYALLVSGTQDEAFSSINRAVRDWLPDDRYSITDNDQICFLQGVIPTGQNAYKRIKLQRDGEYFFGAKITLPEIIEREGEMIFHSSGHNNREDMSRIIELSGQPFMLPVHGGPEQLEAHMEIAREQGCEASLLPGSATVQVSSPKKVTPLRDDPTAMVGVTLHTPSKEKFYLKGRFSTSVVPMKPEIDSDSARLVDRFEDLVRDAAGLSSVYEAGKILPISLSRRFNAQTSNGFLGNDMLFGIEKYKDGVFEDKNIFAIGAFDTETGGLDARRYLIREFGMSMEDLDGNVLDDVQLFQHVPTYRLPSIKARLVTGAHPKDDHEGLPAHLFADEMATAIKSLKEHSYTLAQKADPDAGYTRNQVKALAIAHNEPFDSRFIAAEMSRNLDTNVRPHQTRGLISIDTRAISRAMAAFMPQDYKVDTNTETGLPDHRLESLCTANGIGYDTAKSHGALYDTIPCKSLFRAQYDMAPDVVGQMIVNADRSTNHLLNDVMGVSAGFGGPHPVFSYVSPMAAKSKPQMGCFVGTLENENYIVVFNLKYNPNDYLYKSPDELMSLIKDPENDVFEIFDTRRHPIIMPAKMGMRVRANGSTPKETLDMRAGIVKRHLNFVDPTSGWQTIAQKIDDCWANNRSDIYKERLLPTYPDLEREMGYEDAQATIPEDGAFELRKTRARLGFNPVYRRMHQHIREYLDAVRQENYAGASHVYKDLMRHRRSLGSILEALNNTHYDICPEDLAEKDRHNIEAMRAMMARNNYRIALNEIEQLESDPDEYEKFVGDDKDKQKLFKDIKAWMHEHADLAHMNDQVRDYIRPWRSVTRRTPGQIKRNNDSNGALEVVAS
ncbi:MAG: hypothetical protein JKY71_06045 [Alphaproteobacteria bacterium]|nr:hypothetical protein [Alphaproteobacteria bacterium]